MVEENKGSAGIENMDEENQSQRELQKQNVEDMLKKVNMLVIIKFEDVTHKIKTKGGRGSLGRYCCYLLNKNSDEEKMILKGVSGAVSPGELLAILGPSGCGKTTLLTALGGRLSNGKDTVTQGHITYNGKQFSAEVKRRTGFVAQNNVFYPHLTVAETLVFTALLRLPNSLKREEKVLHAEAVINQLGLARCRNSIIGGRLVRGLSGGERKRISIGQELLINPSLLFLDEPTSGLDSTMAKKILVSLSKLAGGGRTILMTIHQPASSLFYMFNKILLLSSDGSSLYLGKGEDVINYFAGIGYVPSVAMNPADFLLDLANGVASGDPKENREAVKQTLISAYKSNISNKLKQEFEDRGDHSLLTTDSKNYKKTSKWSTTWWQHFSVLLRRDLKERRHDTFDSLKIGQILFLSIITGLIWWQSSTDNIEDQVGLLFFYSRQAGFFPLFQALHTFPLERMMLEKERSSGMYRLSSYIMAKTAGDFVMELVLPTVFVIITYWMGGLKARVINFLSTLAATLYTALVAQSLGLAVGALVLNQRKAGTIATTLMLTFLLTGGFFVQDVTAFISWLEYLSFTHYSYKLLLMSQYNPNDTYVCASNSNSNATCLVGDFPRIKFVGLNNKLLSVVMMAVMFVCYKLITYLALRRVGVTHK